MIALPLFICLAMIVIKLRKGIFATFLVMVATKSIVDAFWDYKFGAVSMLGIQGILVSVLFLPIIKRRKLLPKTWLQSANIYLIALSSGLIWALVVEPMASIEQIIINVNIFLGFLLLPILITTKERLRQFLIAMMICGIFPVLISFYQWQTGVVFQERNTVGLLRYVGLYHDAFPVRFYGLMTLMSIILYQYVFRIKGVFLRGFMLFLSVGVFLSVYLVFSKAAVAILGTWVLLLLLFSKSKIKQGFSLLVGLVVIFLVFGDAVFTNIEQLFSKELGFQTGEIEDVRYTLAGRGYIWEDYWKFWTNKQNVFFQLVGDGLNRPTHNEFLRVLLTNGIIGVFFLVAFINSIVRKSLKIHKTVKVFGLMLLGMYFIDSIGLVPGVYYYYNILVWGIFGLLLLKPELFIKESLNATTDTKAWLRRNDDPRGTLPTTR